jgi:hypothetical protein
MAHAGGARLLARDERVQRVAGVDAEAAGGDLRRHREGLALGTGAHAQGDRTAIEEITDLHRVLNDSL